MPESQTVTLSPPENAEVQITKTVVEEAKPQSETDIILIIPTEASGEKIETKSIDLEKGGDVTNTSSETSDKTLETSFTQRDKFVTKVLAILMGQLLISSTLVGLTFIPQIPARDFLNNYPLVALVLLIVSIVVLLVLTCGRGMARKTPQNYILLFLFTCSFSYTLAFVASFSRSFIVLLSLVFTFTIVLGSIGSVLRSSSSQEFSKKKCLIGQSVPLVLSLGTVGIFFPNIFVSALLSAAIVTFLSIHLLFDIQTLFGNYESKYNKKDYILASLDIYADVCLIFIHALRLFKELLE